MKRLIMLTLMTFAFILSNAKAMEGIYEYQNGNKLVRTKKGINFYMPAEQASKEFKTPLPNALRGKLIPILIGEEKLDAPKYNCHLSTKMSKAQFDGEAKKLGKFKFKPFVAPTPVVKNQQGPIDKFFNKLFNPRQKKRDARTKAMIEKKMQQSNAGKKPAPVVKNQPTEKKPVLVAKKSPAVNKISPLQAKRDVHATKRVLIKRGQPAPTVTKPTPIAKNNPPVNNASPLQAKRDVRTAKRVLNKRGQPAPTVTKPTPIAKNNPPVNKVSHLQTKRDVRLAKRMLNKRGQSTPVVKKQQPPTRKRLARFQRNRNRK